MRSCLKLLEHSKAGQLDVSLQALLRPGDTSWEDFVASGQDTAGFRAHPAEADASTNILFSSGTTGKQSLYPYPPGFCLGNLSAGFS